MAYWQRDTIDPSGRALVRPRPSDPLRNQAIWAVYQIERESYVATAQSSDFLDLATAKATADTLNANRSKAEFYFRVFRLASSKENT